MKAGTDFGLFIHRQYPTPNVVGCQGRLCLHRSLWNRVIVDRLDSCPHTEQVARSPEVDECFWFIHNGTHSAYSVLHNTHMDASRVGQYR